MLRYPAVAAVVGLLAAVAAGALGGWWVGLGVRWRPAGKCSSSRSRTSRLASLLALPAWLAAAAAAGWVAERVRATSDERDRLAAELEAVRESASEAIVGIDGEGTIVKWGAGVEAMYGYSADEVEGRPLSLIAGDTGNGEAWT